MGEGGGGERWHIYTLSFNTLRKLKHNSCSSELCSLYKFSHSVTSISFCQYHAFTHKASASNLRLIVQGHQ